jgi:hypothetical protein
MQKSLKTSSWLRLVAIFLLCGSMAVACNNTEDTKTEQTESETTTMEEMPDSLPKLSTDTPIVLKPEVIVNETRSPAN